MSQPSFYVLSEGQSKDNYTHDTSRADFHHQDLATFCEDVNNAAKRAFPNRGRSRYETVHVCLIRWEHDELGVRQELNTLDAVLQDYGFQTSIFLIPEQNSQWNLMRRTLDFIQDCDNEKNLFILYYAGHGRMNSSRQSEWVSGQDSNSPFVDWSAIQGLFGTAKSDVLILLDTCAAASSATASQYAVMETIAACGFERRAPPPGEDSMTNALVDVLRDWINKPSFSAASLHTEVLFRLKGKGKRKDCNGVPLEWCVTPIHWINAEDSNASAIEICRLNVLPLPSTTHPDPPSEDDTSTFVDAMDVDSDDTSAASTALSSVSSAGTYKVPRVLISLQLEEDQSLNAEQCTKWLDKFPLLAKWVKVEAVFGSFSTLMIMSIPVPIWDMLPDHPACSFVGYVTTPNLGGALRSNGIDRRAIDPVESQQDAKEAMRRQVAKELIRKHLESFKKIVEGLNKRSKYSHVTEHFDLENIEQARIPLQQLQATSGPAVSRAASESYGYPPKGYEQDTRSVYSVESGYGSGSPSMVGDFNIPSHRRPYALNPHKWVIDTRDSAEPPFSTISDISEDYGGKSLVPIPFAVKKTQQLMIGDEAEVEEFYRTRFKDMRRSACVVVAKVFVKLIEPKKPTHHPYTKSDDKAPAWWPNTIGENNVRYREPDHLLNPEQIRLLIHILRMIVQPNEKQHPTVQKLGLNVRKLEQVTMEAMQTWFTDTKHLENGSKRLVLKEIFKIAQAEERYLNGEMGKNYNFKESIAANTRN